MFHFIILLKDQPLEGLYGLIGIIVIGLIFLFFNAAGNGIINIVGRIWRAKNRLELTSEVIMRYTSYLKNFSYYQKLDQENKRKFIIRLAEFMNSKEFRGAEGLEVTEEMKVLISASATQLLFGLDAYCLNFFNVIRVFPRIFYSQLMRVHMKGGTSRSGVIMLSWKDFQEGYKIEDDKLNLGLHELAHALKIEATSGDDYDHNFEDGLNRWDDATAETMERVKNGTIPFLRKYGGANAQEFWAVCVEHFFEAPKEFKEQLPTIYGYLCLLLNQDPLQLNRSESTIEESPTFIGFDTNIVLPPARNAPSPSFGNEILTWACLVLAFPLGAGIAGIVAYELVTNSSIWMTVLAFTSVGILIFYRQWKNQDKNFIQYIVQSVVLCGMVGTLLLHLINYCTGKPYQPEVYKIISTKENYDPTRAKQFPVSRTMILEGHAYEDFDKLLIVPYVPVQDEMIIEISKGVFGIRFVTSISYQFSSEKKKMQ